MAYDPEAVYNQTVADLGLQEGWEEGALGESETNLKASTGYQESEITRAEPGVYRGASYGANRGGILTSGINARRKTDIAANFAARRLQNQLTLTEGEARIKREREGGALKRTRERHGAEERRAEGEDRAAKENPTVAPPAYAHPTPLPPPGAENAYGWITTPRGKYRLGGRRK